MGARVRRGVGVVWVGLLLACGGGSGDGGGGEPTPTPRPSPTVVEVTLSGSGLAPATVVVAPGGQLTLINADDRPHQMASNPHPAHTDCPSLNARSLVAGERVTVTVPSEARVCGMHDHLNPDDTRYRLTVTVSATDPRPGPGTPGY